MPLCSDFYIDMDNVVVDGDRFGLYMGIGRNSPGFIRLASPVDANVRSVCTGIFTCAGGLQMIIMGIAECSTRMIYKNATLTLVYYII